MDNLYHSVNPQDTSTESMVNISRDSVIAQITNNWESHISTVSQMHPQNVPVTAGVTSWNMNTPSPSRANGGHTTTGSQGIGQVGQALPIAPDLEFPNMEQPSTSTHLLRRFQCIRFNNFKWVFYPNPIHESQLPSNWTWVDRHWLNWVESHQGRIFVGYQDDGQAHYLYPGDNGYKEIVEGVATNTTSAANPCAQMYNTEDPTVETTQSILPAPNLPVPVTTPNQASQHTPSLSAPTTVNNAPNASTTTTPNQAS